VVDLPLAADKKNNVEIWLKEPVKVHQSIDRILNGIDTMNKEILSFKFA
jgi:hypothetical protein